MVKFSILTCALFLTVVNVKAQDPVAITRQMFATVKTIKTLQYSFDSKERVANKMVNEVSDFKLQVQPFKVYVYQKVPVKGLEVLYVTGENSGKAKVNPNAFPWVTLNLEPEGSIMLDKHHHSLFDGGFAYTSSLIEYLFQKYEPQISKLIVNKGVVKYAGSDCYYFTLTNPNYKLVNYTVGANETSLSISRKLKINYFSIIENNPSVSGISVIKEGTKLVVPNDYASKMELYIHKDKLYPVLIKIFDAKGLFEEYTFTNVVLNPAFKSDVFSAGNTAYNF